MHKLNLYLDDDRLEKLKILIGETEDEKVEEYINETTYDAITEAWLRHKSESIQKMLESGDYDDETVCVTLGDKEYEVWSDGEMAVISVKDEDHILQKEGGRMHFIFESGIKVECSEETQREFESVLSLAGASLREEGEI